MLLNHYFYGVVLKVVLFTIYLSQLISSKYEELFLKCENHRLLLVPLITKFAKEDEYLWKYGFIKNIMLPRYLNAKSHLQACSSIPTPYENGGPRYYLSVPFCK